MGPISDPNKKISQVVGNMSCPVLLCVWYNLIWLRFRVWSTKFCWSQAMLEKKRWTTDPSFWQLTLIPSRAMCLFFTLQQFLIVMFSICKRVYRGWPAIIFTQGENRVSVSVPFQCLIARKYFLYENMALLFFRDRWGTVRKCAIS